MNGIASIYADKPIAYFGGARDDIVQMLTTDSSAVILEIGCGTGGTGASALASGKAGRYVGIEVDPSAAAIAAKTLTEVVTGDVTQMDLGRFSSSFDALIISEVLEHLTDPGTTLKKLVLCLKPGGAVYASSPNIAHWRIIKDLAVGRFEYTNDGVMDRTHMRWFTPDSFRQMFEDAGVEVASVRPLVPLRWKARLINWLTGGRYHHLFVVQIMIRGRRRD